ncbi:MAG: response regulator transcription factor [Succiniclasticum sp.]|jgi:DNA-binding response OmpR family regulator
MNETILIIEDDTDIGAIEKDYLEINGYKVAVRADGNEGLQAALTENFDLILLDVMLPGIDGFEICRRIREKKDTPILMVTARQSDIDIIRGLGLGADDYIVKPFSPAVLVARVKSHLAACQRMRGTKKLRRITLGNIAIEPDTRLVYVSGTPKTLPNKEFELLEFLMENPGIVFSRETLYTHVWGMDSLGTTDTVPVHINRLREAVEANPSKPAHIITVWGVGYKFQP